MNLDELPLSAPKLCPRAVGFRKNRRILGVSMADACEATGLSAGDIAALEAGQVELPAEQWQALDRALANASRKGRK